DRCKQATGDYRATADRLVKLIEREERRLRKDVDTEVSEGNRRKRAAKKEAPVQRAAVPAPEPAPPTPPARTLPEVLQELGWELEGQWSQLIQTIQSSLEDVLTRESSSYRSVLT